MLFAPQMNVTGCISYVVGTILTIIRKFTGAKPCLFPYSNSFRAFLNYLGKSYPPVHIVLNLDSTPKLL